MLLKRREQEALENGNYPPDDLHCNRQGPHFAEAEKASGQLNNFLIPLFAGSFSNLVNIVSAEMMYYKIRFSTSQTERW